MTHTLDKHVLLTNQRDTKSTNVRSKPGFVTRIFSILARELSGETAHRYVTSTAMLPPSTAHAHTRAQ